MSDIISESELKTAELSDSRSDRTEHSRRLKKCIRKESAVCYTDFKLAGSFRKIFQTGKKEERRMSSDSSHTEVISIKDDNREDLEKCIRFWKQIMQENLEPVRCTLIEKAQNKKKNKNKRGLSVDEVQELASLRKAVAEMQKNQEDMKKIFKDAVAEIQKKKLHKMRLQTKVKCPQCKILNSDVPADAACLDSRLDDIKELNNWVPKRKYPPPKIKSLERVDTFGLLNEQIDKLIEQKEERGEFSQWSKPQRKICECNYLPDCICNTYNVISKESIHAISGSGFNIVDEPEKTDNAEVVDNAEMVDTAEKEDSSTKEDSSEKCEVVDIMDIEESYPPLKISDEEIKSVEEKVPSEENKQTEEVKDKIPSEIKKPPSCTEPNADVCQLSKEEEIVDEQKNLELESRDSELREELEEQLEEKLVESEEEKDEAPHKIEFDKRGSEVVRIPSQEVERMDREKLKSLRASTSKPSILVEEHCSCGMKECDCVKRFSPIQHQIFTDVEFPTAPVFNTVPLAEATSSLELYAHLKNTSDNLDSLSDLDANKVQKYENQNQKQTSYMLPDGKRIFIEPQVFDNLEMPKLPDHIENTGSLLKHKPSMELLKYKGMKQRAKKTSDIDKMPATALSFTEQKAVPIKVLHQPNSQIGKDLHNDKIPKSLSNTLRNQKLILFDKQFPSHVDVQASNETIQTLTQTKTQKIKVPTTQVFQASSMQNMVRSIDSMVPRDSNFVRVDNGVKKCTCGYNDCTCFVRKEVKEVSDKIMRKLAKLSEKEIVPEKKRTTCRCGYNDCACTTSDEKIRASLAKHSEPKVAAPGPKKSGTSYTSSMEAIFPGKEICQLYNARIITNNKAMISECINKRKESMKKPSLIERQINSKRMHRPLVSPKSNPRNFNSAVSNPQTTSTASKTSTGNFYSDFYKKYPDKYQKINEQGVKKQFPVLKIKENLEGKSMKKMKKTTTKVNKAKKTTK